MNARDIMKLSDSLPDEEINDLIEPVCLLADMETTSEAPDIYEKPDELLDNLILAARNLRDREGFLVTDGNDEPGYTQYTGFRP
jgi:hypothetical protein